MISVSRRMTQGLLCSDDDGRAAAAHSGGDGVGR